MSRLEIVQISQVQKLEDKKISTLKKEEIYNFYKSKINWDIKEIAQFEKRLEKLKKEDLEYFHSIAGFNFYGYGNWIVENWDFAFDSIVDQIGRVHRYNEDTISKMRDWMNYRVKVKHHYPFFGNFAMDRKYKFVRKVNEDVTAFDYMEFAKYHHGVVGFNVNDSEVVFRKFKQENRSMKVHRYKMKCGYENIKKSPYLQA